MRRHDVYRALEEAMRTMQASVLRTLVHLLLVAGCARFNPRPL
jgi:hypothetical protein